MRTGRRHIIMLGAVICLSVVTLACGSGQRVGSERLLEFEEQEDARRLGERTPPPTPSGTPSSLSVDEGRSTATPEAGPTATPQAFDVALIANSPFYEPGNSITIQRGVTLRVTNKDQTPERAAKGRSFTAKNGAFHSGLLKPGEQWTFVPPAGAYEIVDEGLNFATAVLRVL